MGLESERHPIADKKSRTKHVVAAGWLTWDGGSIPPASTIFYRGLLWLLILRGRYGTACVCESSPKTTGGGTSKSHNFKYRGPYFDIAFSHDWETDGQLIAPAPNALLAILHSFDSLKINKPVCFEPVV